MRFRNRGGGRRSYAKRSYGLEAALQHIADAHQLSARLGGMDAEVKEFFFSLPKDKLTKVLEGYGRKYGKEKRSYAAATLPKWKDGTVHMSGLVAERLFDFLPPIMPINLKLRIVEGLFENSGAAKADFVLAPFNAPPSEIFAFVSRNLLGEIEGQKIAAGLKSQFGWLAGEDTTVAEQILQHSLMLAVDAKKVAATEIMQQMDRDLAVHGDVLREFITTVRFRRHEVHIKRSAVAEEIGSVNRWTFERDGRKTGIHSATNGGLNWIIWLGLGLGVLWFLSTR